ncbi:tRNA pseudouridine(38-40) synthase TruA [Candidatus Dependentiae bacterium]
MQKYKIVVAYDGTDYFGWQQQKGLPTVAQALQDSFFKVFKKRISLLGASRTDAGVHALGQVARFRVDLNIEPAKMFYAWNNLLPSDVVIRKLMLADQDFNPHCNVVQKEYHYHFFLERPLPIYQRYGWYYRYPVDIKKLENVLQVFVGTHDFRSFCTGDDRENTVRTIDAIEVQEIKKFNAYRVIVLGQKFLRYMVRRMVGAGLEVASRPYLSDNDLQKALEKKDPEQTLPKAPAKGLMLHRIVYDCPKPRDIGEF